MTYTIKQVSEMMSLPVSTIRYYDKMGLIPFLEKNESGYRIFKEKDIPYLLVYNKEDMLKEEQKDSLLEDNNNAVYVIKLDVDKDDKSISVV